MAPSCVDGGLIVRLDGDARRAAPLSAVTNQSEPGGWFRAGIGSEPASPVAREVRRHERSEGRRTSLATGRSAVLPLGAAWAGARS